MGKGSLVRRRTSIELVPSRWVGVKQSIDKSLVVDIDTEYDFNLALRVCSYWDPSGLAFRGVEFDGDTGAAITSPYEGSIFFGVVASTLLRFISESKKGVTIYNPQRVMCQFGYVKLSSPCLVNLLCRCFCWEARFTGHGIRQISRG